MSPLTSATQAAAVASAAASSSSSDDLCLSTPIVAGSSCLSSDTLSSDTLSSDRRSIEEIIAIIRTLMHPDSPPQPDSLPQFNEQRIRDTSTFVSKHWPHLSQLPGPYVYTSETAPYPLPLRVVPGKGAFFDTYMQINRGSFKIVSLAIFFIREGTFLPIVHAVQYYTQDDANKSYTIGKNELEIITKIPPTADRIIQHFHIFEEPGLEGAGCFHFYQEFAPGGALVDWIDDQKLTVGNIHQFALDILRGLGQFVQLGIVHCDMKPDNVLITYEFDPDTKTYKTVAKICDFGSSFFSEKKTWTPKDVATRAYCSPEMLDGLAPSQNDKIDPFAYACTLLTMLKGGETPWHEDIKHPLDPALRRPRITSYVTSLLQRKSTLDTFLAKLLEPDPQRRITIPEAQELASSLTIQDFASWSDPTAPVASLTSQVGALSIHERP